MLQFLQWAFIGWLADEQETLTPVQSNAILPQFLLLQGSVISVFVPPKDDLVA